MLPVLKRRAVAILPNNEKAPRIPLTRKVYHNIISMGFLGEEPRCELIEGEIVAKIGQKRKHAMALRLIQRRVEKIFGEEYVEAQVPVAADEYNEPEPDVFVLNKPTEECLDTPIPADIRLVMEVTNTTVDMDRETKASIYARVGIPEYWIVDVNERNLCVHRLVSPGVYAEPTLLAERDFIAPLSAPDSLISVADLLPPMGME